MYLLIPGYVYKITHKKTEQFYFGSRVANIKKKLVPEKDFWIHYFSSSKKIKEIIRVEGVAAFHTEILYTNTNADEVFWQEQELIKEHIKNPLCLNKHYKDKSSGHKAWSTHGVEPVNKNKSSPYKGIARPTKTVKLMSQNRKGKNVGQVPWNKGKKNVYDAKTLQLMSEYASNNFKGKGNPFYGKTHTDETKKLLAEAQKTKVVCPHCNKTGSISIMKRWHFDKCKYK